MIQVTELKLLQKTRILTITFDNGQQFDLPCELLRAYSPSAEMRNNPTAQISINPDINITAIEPVGNYAVKLIFDDGHETGIYSWDTLYELGLHQDEKWRTYQLKRESANG